MRRFFLAMLIIVMSTPASPAAYAGKKNVPNVGDEVTAYSADNLSPVQGTIVEMELDKKNPLNPDFVWVQVSPTDGGDNVFAWLKMPGKKKKKQKPVLATGCCQNTSVVVVNNHTADVPLVRHYTGPAYFSQTTVVHNHTTVRQTQYCAPVRRYCDCHRPIERYIYRNGARVGHYCVTTGQAVPWQ